MITAKPQEQQHYRKTRKKARIGDLISCSFGKGGDVTGIRGNGTIVEFIDCSNKKSYSDFVDKCSLLRRKLKKEIE